MRCGRTHGGGGRFLAGLILLLCVAAAPAPADELDFGLERHLIHRIEVRGNVTFSDARLKSLLRIREPRRFHPLTILGLADRGAYYQPHLLEVELKLIERFYLQRGFHQVKVRLVDVTPDPEGRGDVIVIGVDEGPRTYLDEVRFEGDEGLIGPKVRASLRYRPGDPAPADLNDLGADIYRLRTHLWEGGHLQADITPELWVAAAPDTALRRDAVLTYRIVPGPSYVVGAVDIEGNVRTRAELIRSRLRLREGDLFRWSDVEESQRRLLETALFRDVGFIPARIDTAAGTADLVVQVVERKPAYTEFGFGVGSRERIRMLAAWGHNNLFGSGQSLRLRTRNSLNYEDVQRLSDGRGDPELNYRYDLTHVLPSVLGGLRLESNVYLEKETRGESGLNLGTRGFSVGSRFGFGRRTAQALTMRFERVDPDIHPDAIAELRDVYEASNLSDAATHSLGWDLLDERRDNPLRPRRGTMRAIHAEVGGGPLGGDNSFWKLSGELHYYTGTPLGGVLAMRVSAGIVQPYAASLDRGADGVPYQERFFAGGVSTVRGYEERSLGPQIADADRDSLQLALDVPLPERPARGGNYRLLTNAEWRFPMPLLRIWKVSGVAFLDGGNVWKDWQDIRLQGFRWRSFPREGDDPKATKIWDYRWSLGVGVRVDTPVGPVRMDVGFPMKRAKLGDATESGVLYHFSLGYPF